MKNLIPLPKKTLLGQYHSLKSASNAAVIFFRFPDNCISFNEDAIRLSEDVGVKLTRNIDYPNQCETIFPTSKLDSYVSEYTQKGLKVIIVDQMESWIP